MAVSLDFETRSPLDLKKVGLYRYAEEAEIHCLALAVDDDEPFLWLPGDPAPDVLSDGIEFAAWNASFERVIWSALGDRYGFPPCPPPEQFTCTMARAALAGLPLALGMAAAALGLPEDQQKFKRGRYLIQKLCKPQRNGRYCEDPELLQELYGYCVQDVVVERAAGKALPPMTYRERRIWCMNERMNDRGLPVDTAAVDAASSYLARGTKALNTQLEFMTGGQVTTVGQVANMLAYVRAENPEIPNLQAGTVTDALEGKYGELTNEVEETLTIRKTAGLASLKKFAAAETRLEKDGRLRGSLRYHGAATGRWSATGFQPHNLKRPSISFQDADKTLTQLTSNKTLKGLSYLRGMDRLSNCVRGVIRPAAGKVLLASDYSQIELRTLLWLANDRENLKEIREGTDPYVSMAAEVYHLPPGKITKERQMGKAAVLGCGYGQGWKGFITFAKGYGVILDETMARQVVGVYRRKYEAVVSFWYALEAAVKSAIADKSKGVELGMLKIQNVRPRWLEIRLPSGRVLRYFRPRLVPSKFGWGDGLSIQYEGTDTFTRRWGNTTTYGGKLVENVTQATARDIMAAGMLNAEAAGLDQILTVHDEVICEDDEPGDLDLLNSCLLDAPGWANGLPLEVEGWVGTRYRK